MNNILQNINSKSYNEYGKKVSATATGDRLGFIADDCLVAENDAESGLGDFGVRKYDNGRGSFLSIDPLWENDLDLEQFGTLKLLRKIYVSNVR